MLKYSNIAMSVAQVNNFFFGVKSRIAHRKYQSFQNLLVNLMSLNLASLDLWASNKVLYSVVMMSLISVNHAFVVLLVSIEEP